MKKRSKFLPALIIYCLVLILIIGGGLIFLNKFLTSYEASRPDNAVEAFFEEKDRSFWLDNIQSVISEGFNEFTDPEATIADLGLDPNAELSWRSAAGGDDSTLYYDVKLGSALVGRLTVTPDADVGFDMRSWKVTGWSFDPGKDTSITVCVPEGCTAYVNGVAVSDAYLSGTGKTNVTLSHDFDIAPDSNIYVIDGMRGPIEVKAYDANGVELEADGVTGSEVAFLCQPEFSTSFWAASDAHVYINGIEVSGRHVSATGSGLDESVEFLYYEFSDLYTQPEVTVTSAGGESVEPVTLSLGERCYIPGASVSIDGALESFIERFIHAYVDFGANKDHDAEGNFAVLSGYLVAGTDLYQTCASTVENIAWATTSDLVYHDIGCYDLMPLGNGDYVCHITYDVSYQFATTQRDIVADYVVLIRPEGNSYRVLAMSPEL